MTRRTPWCGHALAAVFPPLRVSRFAGIGVLFHVIGVFSSLVALWDSVPFSDNELSGSETTGTLRSLGIHLPNAAPLKTSRLQPPSTAPSKPCSRPLVGSNHRSYSIPVGVYKLIPPRSCVMPLYPVQIFNDGCPDGCAAENSCCAQLQPVGRRGQQPQDVRR